MAIAHGRLIIVDGVEYRWRADGYFDRYATEWTSPTLRLSIFGGGFLRKLRCDSAQWTPEHSVGWIDGDYSAAGPHKVEFGPSMVAQIIRHTFAKGEALTLGDWTVVEDKRIVRTDRRDNRRPHRNFRQTRRLVYSRR